MNQQNKFAFLDKISLIVTILIRTLLKAEQFESYVIKGRESTLILDLILLYRCIVVIGKYIVLHAVTQSK